MIRTLLIFLLKLFRFGTFLLAVTIYSRTAAWFQ